MRDLGNPVLGHGGMLRKEAREGRKRPSRAGRSRPRERGENAAGTCLVETSDAGCGSLLAALRKVHQGGGLCVQAPPSIVATTCISPSSSGSQASGSRSSTTRSAR